MRPVRAWTVRDVTPRRRHEHGTPAKFRSFGQTAPALGNDNGLGDTCPKGIRMTASSRSAVVTALLGLVCLLAALPFYRGGLGWADPPAPLTPLLVPSMEPPLAGSAVPTPAPTPSKTPAAAIPAQAASRGTAHPNDPPPPVVALRVRVPASVSANQEIEYRLCIENRSTAAAHHVLVRNPLPAAARFVRATPEPTTREPELTWQLGTLEGGACREIVLVLQATGTDDITNCARVQFEHGECVTTRIARPALQVKKCGPKEAALYDHLTYQVSVTNTGSVEAAGVAVTDTLPDGLEHAGGKNTLNWDLGKLGPGECRQVEYQAIAKKAGRLCNKAVAVAEGGLRSETESCVVVGEAKLTLEAEGPERRFVTRPATYQLTVGNPGTMPAGNVVLADPLPDGARFLQASNGGQFTDGQIRWLIGTLPPGTRRTVQVTLQAQKPGEMINRIEATGNRGLQARTEVRTIFEGATGLTADVEVKDNPVEVGAKTTYLVTITNQGSVPASEVRIVALVPEQMTILDAKGPTPHQQEGRQITFEPLPTLKPRGEVRYEIQVKAQQTGDVRFKVDLTAKELPAGPVHREQSTNIYQSETAPPQLQPPQPVPPPSQEPPPAKP